VRPATGLSQAEATWVDGRKKVVLDALDGYLERLGLEDFDSCAYVNKLKENNHANVPILSFAISGGGYSSAFTGTAALRALDNRLPAANKQKTGGLLQALTYLTGLSGGAWPALSFPAYNFPTADQLLQYWQPQISRFNANETTQYVATNVDMFQQIAQKLEAGFDVGMPDYFGLGWGRE
jgi:lysophospholipase